MFNSQSKIFCYFLLCFIAGVGLASFVFFDYFYLGLFILFFLILLSLLWPRQFYRWILIGGIIFIFGIFRYQLSLPVTNETKIWFYNSQKIDFTGVVTEEPDIRTNRIRLIISVLEIAKISGNSKISGQVLVTANLYPQYQYGDLVTVSCRLSAPQSFADFAYDRYLAKDGIYSECIYPKIKLIAAGNGDWLLTEIFGFKNKLLQIINSNLPEPQASLFAAIILGARRGLPQALMDKFNITATTHLIAISGMNITIISALLLDLLLNFYISRKKAFWLITFALIFYIILVGAPASAVRAAIMGYLALLARHLGRLNRAANALIFTAAAMIFINPKILRDDVGFQLSFLAVLGLIYFLPLLENRFSKFSNFLGVKESLQMTLAAQLSTLPLIIYNFGRLSLIGPITNLFVVALLPFLTIAGFVVLFLSLFFSYSALFFPLWLGLTYLIKVVEFFAAIPFAAISL
ncbi:MAG: ComEC/Rec2 family competence protein [Patescibacteria group bacterium]|jgi:competence protein ComEC